MAAAESHPRQETCQVSDAGSDRHRTGAESAARHARHIRGLAGRQDWVRGCPLQRQRGDQLRPASVMVVPSNTTEPGSQANMRAIH